MTSFSRITVAELRLLKVQHRFRQRRGILVFLSAVSRVGNGWLYLAILALIMLLGGDRALKVIAAGTLGVIGAHIVYLPLKRTIKRPRPCDVDDDLMTSVTPLDRYSFPSGHMATLTAALVPIHQSYPHLTTLCVASLVLMAWARMGIGHHYPSDIAGGVALGLLSSGVASYALL